MRQWGFTLATFVLAAAMLACGPRSVPAQQNPHGLLPVGGMVDPLLLLLHDPVVHAELKLTASQQVLLGRLCDKLDVDLWTTRNQTADKADEVRQRLKTLANQELEEILTPDQSKRLLQIERRTIGVRVFLREDLIKILELAPAQQESIRGILQKAEAGVAALAKEAPAGKLPEQLDDEARKLHTQSQKDVWQVLDAAQQERARGAIGSMFDSTKLGRIRLRAPEFQPAAAWINSDRMALKELKGEVVVVFFWTYGCINCIRNYPWYLGWQKDFADRGVRIVGIHTPEVDGERDVERVRNKVRENGFEFPVLVDNERKNWDAWGNSMWPSTYIIDRQGYVRAWWLGELNWERQPGEKMLRKKIEELLAE